MRPWDQCLGSPRSGVDTTTRGLGKDTGSPQGCGSQQGHGISAMTWISATSWGPNSKHTGDQRTRSRISSAIGTVRGPAQKGT